MTQLRSQTLPIFIDFDTKDGVPVSYYSQDIYDSYGGTSTLIEGMGTYYFYDPRDPDTEVSCGVPVPSNREFGVTTTTYYVEDVCIFYEFTDGGFSMPLYRTVKEGKDCYPEGNFIPLHITTRDMS